MTTLIIEPLAPAQIAELDRLEAVISAGLQTFMAVGNALAEISQKRLYLRDFTSFEEYCRERWNISDKRAYQFIRGAAVQGSTDVDLPTEAVARELDKQVKTLDVSVDQLAQVAQTIATTAQRAMNTRDVQHAAAALRGSDPEDAVRQEVYASGMAMIIQLMNTKQVTPKNALLLVNAIKSCVPRVRGDVLMLQVVNTAIIHELNRLFVQRHESYSEIVATKVLQFADGRCVWIKDAKPAALRAWLDEKHIEYKRRASAEKDAEAKIIPVNLTLYTNAVQRNVDIIRTMLGEQQARLLAEAILGLI